MKYVEEKIGVTPRSTIKMDSQPQDSWWVFGNSKRRKYFGNWG
jgi:hypothetical protein